MRVLAALLLLLYTLATNAAEPANVPYRTDFANERLPWYRLKPGEFPPVHSEHRVGGELVKVDFIHRTGQFRADGGGELVDFTLPAFRVRNLSQCLRRLRDVPLRTHMLFFLYQDEKGAFNKVAHLMDDYRRRGRPRLYLSPGRRAAR